MDLFGHTAASLLVGRAVAGGARERRATTAAALLAGLLPDIDAVTYLAGADVFRRIHQLFTHNLLAAAILPAAVAWAISRWARGRSLSVFVAAYLAIAVHLLGDLIGLWPIPLFWPFSDHRVAWLLLDRDFCWELDAILVLGAVLTFWDPIAARTGAVRALTGITLAAGAVWVLL